MTRSFLAIAAFSLALAMPVAGQAQSLTDLVSPQNGGTAGQPRPAQQAQNSGSSGLSTGTALNDGGVAVGESYERGTFGDWQLTCVKTGQPAEPCRLSQNLTDETGGSVARIEIFPTNDPNLSAGAAVLAPLGTLLPRGVRMSIADGPVKMYPFIICNRESCISEFGLLADEVAAMKSGASGQITLVAAAAVETPVDVKLSLSGFTKAYEEFEKLTAGLF
ncbi:MAG: invasion associated locus B family protein [Mangrovicoccus sp.]|nr:invasion associated locus B family protein [Mangrovicoccus sp.]